MIRTEIDEARKPLFDYTFRNKKFSIMIGYSGDMNHLFDRFRERLENDFSEEWLINKIKNAINKIVMKYPNHLNNCEGEHITEEYMVNIHSSNIKFPMDIEYDEDRGIYRVVLITVLDQDMKNKGDEFEMWIESNGKRSLNPEYVYHNKWFSYMNLDVD